MPRSLREHMIDFFLRLKQGSMTVLKYKAQFHDLPKHATSILMIVYEQTQCFIWGLSLVT